jgi:hypothetical protein
MEFKDGAKAICYPKVFDEGCKNWVVDSTHKKCNWKYNGSVVTIIGHNKYPWGTEYKVSIDEFNAKIGMSHKPYYYFDEDELEERDD